MSADYDCSMVYPISAFTLQSCQSINPDCTCPDLVGFEEWMECDQALLTGHAHSTCWSQSPTSIEASSVVRLNL